MRITSELQAHGADDTGVAPLELFDYQSRSDLFSAVAGLYPVDANLTGGDQPERVEVMLASPNYFSISESRRNSGASSALKTRAPAFPK